MISCLLATSDRHLSPRYCAYIMPTYRLSLRYFSEKSAVFIKVTNLWINSLFLSLESVSNLLTTEVNVDGILRFNQPTRSVRKII